MTGLAQGASGSPPDLKPSPCKEFGRLAGGNCGFSNHACRGIEKMSGWIKQFSCLGQARISGSGSVRTVPGLHVIAYDI